MSSPRARVAPDDKPIVTGPRSTSTAPKKFRCTICERGFTKSEHLARHARSHLKEKPFQCPICQKCFGRQDVLARHKRVHDNQPTTPSKPPSTHKPPATSQSPTTTPASAQSLPGAIQTGWVSQSSNIQSSTAYDPSTSASYSQPYNAIGQTDPQLEPQAPMDTLQPWSQGGGDMLEFLLSDFHNWPVTLPVMQFQSSAIQPDLESAVSPAPNSQQIGVPGPGHHAMHQLSQLISDISSGLTAEIESTGITSGFLDTCMHVFFERFHTSFPIIHKATFQVRESSHPLLLNIIALGSLFVGAKDAVPKGEALWRLAHTAVCTSWQALISTRGPRDDYDGVQLLLTALTGQTYALLSKNESLRMTSQVFHGLGFAWARQCGWYNIRESYNLANVPSLEAPEQQKVEAWRVWAAGEVQNRAILGHYVLDGQISQFSGNAPSARHVINPLFTPSSEAAFFAPTADDWILEMGKHGTRARTFRELYVSLFSPNTTMLDYPLSIFSVRVILEGMQSLVSDAQEGDGPAVGTPSRSTIAWALVRLYREHLGISNQESVENMELLVRWHAICLNLACPVTILCQRMCTYYGVEQRLHREIRLPSGDFDLRAWSQSVDGRRALLHAMAIQDLVDRLPLGRSHAIHLPAAIFAVATVYSARCIAALPTIQVPKSILWEDVWTVDTTDPNIRTHSSTEMDAFLHSASDSIPGESLKRNLMYDLNSLQITLSSMSLRWGVSHAMDDILNRWIGIANEASRGI
ncbi:hypothetical protein BP6252_10654 [Coleophoma cylindrospora]|uniref:C2H2-type domain-containing protein n=1 Tax=Coleophoma cylindrospora TaxID=1849047 RepID=A0A3D8QT58_9HELO|nr:hypothetical protein BP6252_10654 [Coleophoma cylindrospora]